MKHAAGISRGHGIRRNVLGHDGAGADDAAGADCYSRHDKSARADEGFFADRDLRRDKRYLRTRKVVSACAQIGFLSNRRPRADLDLT